MIRFFIYALAALAVGALISIQMGEDPGYVLLSFHNYSFETSLVVLLFVVLLLFILIYGILWLLKAVNPLKLFRGKTWAFFNGSRTARTSTERGLLLLAEGQYQEAYKLLLQSANRVDNPLQNYLAAALAAFKSGDRTSWMYCLEQAEKTSGAGRAIDSLKALLELNSGNLEQSLAILLELRKEQPSNKYLLTLLRDIYLSLSDWEKLDGILPELEKYRLMHEDVINDLHVKVAMARLAKAAESSRGVASLDEVWDAIPRKLKKDERLLGSFLDKLLRFGDNDRAVNMLTKYLKHHWSDKLVQLLGFVESKDCAQQILLLEHWLKDRPNNAVLALTLGRLSLRNQQWNKGREYFESALRFSRNERFTAEVNAELGRLFEHLGEHERSVACYRQAMNLLDKKLPNLPMPS